MKGILIKLTPPDQQLLHHRGTEITENYHREGMFWFVPRTLRDKPKGLSLFEVRSDKASFPLPRRD
jgi:hypothetical protein